MDIDDFRTLLLNRSEIEKALDLNLTNVLTADEQYLSDYAMFPVIPLESVIAIFLGLNPDDQNRNRKHPRYWVIYKAIENAVKRGEISAEVEQEFDDFGNEYRYDISLSHNVAKAWAKVHGLKWNVPPYRPITQNLDDSGQEADKEKDEIIERQRAENETLRARIDELESQVKEQSAVNSEQVLESPKATRTSQAQRDIFSLLVVQNYPNCVTRNSLLESINADLRRIGINTKGISYPTLNNLIDEDLRIKVTTQDGKTIEKSPFPDKAKK